MTKARIAVKIHNGMPALRIVHCTSEDEQWNYETAQIITMPREHWKEMIIQMQELLKNKKRV